MIISEHGIIGSIIIIGILISLISNKFIFLQKKIDVNYLHEIYFIISMVPIFPTGSFFRAYNFFSFFKLCNLSCLL